jgi:hypothetical protein
MTWSTHQELDDALAQAGLARGAEGGCAGAAGAARGQSIVRGMRRALPLPKKLAPPAPRRWLACAPELSASQQGRSAPRPSESSCIAQRNGRAAEDAGRRACPGRGRCFQRALADAAPQQTSALALAKDELRATQAQLALERESVADQVAAAEARAAQARKEAEAAVGPAQQRFNAGATAPDGPGSRGARLRVIKGCAGTAHRRAPAPGGRFHAPSPLKRRRQLQPALRGRGWRSCRALLTLPLLPAGSLGFSRRAATRPNFATTAEAFVATGAMKIPQHFKHTSALVPPARCAAASPPCSLRPTRSCGAWTWLAAFQTRNVFDGDAHVRSRACGLRVAQVHRKRGYSAVWAELTACPRGRLVDARQAACRCRRTRSSSRRAVCARNQCCHHGGGAEGVGCAATSGG